jgi:hypothetical protein
VRGDEEKADVYLPCVGRSAGKEQAPKWREASEATTTAEEGQASSANPVPGANASLVSDIPGKHITDAILTIQYGWQVQTNMDRERPMVRTPID